MRKSLRDDGPGLEEEQVARGVLEEIVAQKRVDVAESRSRLPDAVLRSLVQEMPTPRSLTTALESGQGPRVIAEIKRASPSKGVLRADLKPFEWDPLSIMRGYEKAGAAALSVLTDVRYFWGQPELVSAAKGAVSIPILRKDFVIDPWQVLESRWLGADAVLLLVRSHTEQSLHDCFGLARELGMDVLVEVHADEELESALALPGAIIGINHRDLSTLILDPERALTLRPRIPQDRLAVAESGISCRQDLQRLVKGGFGAFLIGGHLSAAPDPGEALAELLSEDRRD